MMCDTGAQDIKININIHIGREPSRAAPPCWLMIAVLAERPPARLVDLFDSPAIRTHVGKLIADAIRKSAQEK